MSDIFVSAFHKAEVDVEYFFAHPLTSLARFARAFIWLFHHSPTGLSMVLNFINQLAPMVVGAITIADTAVAPEAAFVLSTIQDGLAGLLASANAANSGGSFLAQFKNFAATIPSTLLSLDIKDTQLKNTIIKIATFIEDECKVLIPAVETWVKQLAGAGAAPAPPAA